MAQLGTRLLTGVMVALFPACDRDRGDCPTDVDVLLAQVEQSAPGRVNCGSFHAPHPGKIQDALDCFLPADEEQAPARELTISTCIDCLMKSTYIVTSEGERFRVYRQGNRYDTLSRVVEVERCSGFEVDARWVIRCEGAELLYVCED